MDALIKTPWSNFNPLLFSLPYRYMTVPKKRVKVGNSPKRRKVEEEIIMVLEMFPTLLKLIDRA